MQKHIFGHVTSLVEMSAHHILNTFPEPLYKFAKYERNPPYSTELIAITKDGARGFASPMYKQASLVGCLIK